MIWNQPINVMNDIDGNIELLWNNILDRVDILNDLRQWPL